MSLPNPPSDCSSLGSKAFIVLFPRAPRMSRGDASRSPRGTHGGLSRLGFDSQRQASEADTELSHAMGSMVMVEESSIRTRPTGYFAIKVLQKSVRKLEERCEKLEATVKEQQVLLEKQRKEQKVWQTWWERYGESMSSYMCYRFWCRDEPTSWKQ